MEVAQILGILAVILFLLSYQFKTRRNIIVVNIISRAFYVLQYIFLGAFEGAIFDCIGIVASFIDKNKKREKIAKHITTIFVIIGGVLLAAGIYLYEDGYSIFALLGIFFEITAFFVTRPAGIRLVSLIAAPLWFVYNFANEAYGSAIGNVLIIISIVLAMIRLDKKRR